MKARAMWRLLALALVYPGVCCGAEGGIAGGHGHLLAAQNIQELNQVVLTNWEDFAGEEYGLSRPGVAVSYSQGDPQTEVIPSRADPRRFWCGTGDDAIEPVRVRFRWGKHIAASVSGDGQSFVRHSEETTVFGHPVDQLVQTIAIASSNDSIYSGYRVGDVCGSYFTNVHAFDLNKDFKALSVRVVAVEINTLSQPCAQGQPWPEVARGNVLGVPQRICALFDSALSRPRARLRSFGSPASEVQVTDDEEGASDAYPEGSFAPERLPLGGLRCVPFYAKFLLMGILGWLASSLVNYSGIRGFRSRWQGELLFAIGVLCIGAAICAALLFSGSQ